MGQTLFHITDCICLCFEGKVCGLFFSAVVMTTHEQVLLFCTLRCIVAHLVNILT